MLLLPQLDHREIISKLRLAAHTHLAHKFDRTINLIKRTFNIVASLAKISQKQKEIY